MAKTKLKPTVGVLAIVIVMFVVILIAGGVQLYRAQRAPTIVPPPPPEEVTLTPYEPLPSVTPRSQPSPTPTSEGEGWTVEVDAQGREYLAPPHEDERALREAFEIILRRTHILTAPVETLLAYDRPASIEAARAYVSEAYEGNLLEDEFVFVDREWGPENPIRCTSHSECEVARAVLYTEAVVIFDEEICVELGRTETPCIQRFDEGHTIDAQFHLHVYTFVREEGSWRLLNWESRDLPEPPGLED